MNRTEYRYQDPVYTYYYYRDVDKESETRISPNADINKVAEFTLQILTDTDLLYTNKLSIVFSLWSEVKRTLNNRGVRFDKFQDIDISWRDEELEHIIDKRLYYYSIDKRVPVTLRSLISFDNLIAPSPI